MWNCSIENFIVNHSIQLYQLYIIMFAWEVCGNWSDWTNKHLLKYIYWTRKQPKQDWVFWFLFSLFIVDHHFRRDVGSTLFQPFFCVCFRIWCVDNEVVECIASSARVNRGNISLKSSLLCVAAITFEPKKRGAAEVSHNHFSVSFSFYIFYHFTLDQTIRTLSSHRHTHIPTPTPTIYSVCTTRPNTEILFFDWPKYLVHRMI